MCSDDGLHVAEVPPATPPSGGRVCGGQVGVLSGLSTADRAMRRAALIPRSRRTGPLVYYPHVTCT